MLSYLSNISFDIKICLLHLFFFFFFKFVYYRKSKIIKYFNTLTEDGGAWRFI